MRPNMALSMRWPMSTPYVGRCGGTGVRARCDARSDLEAHDDVGHDPAELDASGCVVTPGFIDVHANLTWGPLLDSACRVAAFQGVTTAVTGNCGGSLFPAKGDAAGWVDNICSDHGADRTWTDLPG